MPPGKTIEVGERTQWPPANQRTGAVVLRAAGLCPATSILIRRNSTGAWNQEERQPAARGQFVKYKLPNRLDALAGNRPRPPRHPRACRSPWNPGGTCGKAWGLAGHKMTALRTQPAMSTLGRSAEIGREDADPPEQQRDLNGLTVRSLLLAMTDLGAHTAFLSPNLAPTLAGPFASQNSLRNVVPERYLAALAPPRATG